LRCSTGHEIARLKPILNGPFLDGLKQHGAFQDSNQLLHVDFITLNEYLYLLRDVSRELGTRKAALAMWYLAAAVSDFYVPEERMLVHKIQSGAGSLLLHMEQVPKVLKPLVEQWASKGFICSFKVCGRTFRLSLYYLLS
jgi:phosphopantothenate-cysteine ligase